MASLFVPLALAAFVPAVVACFLLLGPRRGMLASLLGGWLLLPVFDRMYELPLLHTKGTFVPAVVLAASLVFDATRWRRFRLSLIDVPMAVFCLVPFASSLVNELPWWAVGTSPYYDAFSAIFESSMEWGTPYLLGRLYLGEPEGLSEFATSLIASALAYVPLCLLELRLSPQLHRIIYGYHQHAFVQHIRGSGFRPMVFMTHGLMVAIFMACGTIAAFWLWRTRARRAFMGVPLGWVFGLLAVTTLLCKSLGASVLLGAGIATLEATRRLRTVAPLVALLAIPAVYCTARLSGWSPQHFETMTREMISQQRAESLGVRIDNEDVLMGRALLKPWLGWGRWGGHRSWDEEGRDIVVTDGLWILTLGRGGFVGLLALWLLLTLPVAWMLWLFPARHWAGGRLAPGALLAVASLLATVDDLFNALMTPMLVAIPGALASLCLIASKARMRRLRATRAGGDSVGAVTSWAQSSGR